jgi:hypothetical protein
VVYREVREGAEPAPIGYSAHWREDNQNPALASFLKVLGERYPLPAADVLLPRRNLAKARSLAMKRASMGAMSLAGSTAF